MRKLPTGEPCAGEPHARFGGRGRRKPFPDPYQFACVKLIVRRLNELAIHFRENKPSIDNLRLQLVIVRRPVPL